jgi:hypothetical protein
MLYWQYSICACSGNIYYNFFIQFIILAITNQEKIMALGLLKRKWFWKLSWKVTLVVIATGYYAHVLYDKAHFQTSASDVIAHDYNALVAPFLNLLGKAEGNSSTFYADNKGYAIGYGFNPTQNSREYNQGILDFAKVDKQTAQTILNESGKYRNVSNQGKNIPEDLKNVHLSQDEINRMALYAQHSYEKSFITVLQERMQAGGYAPDKIQKALVEYQNLPDNQKAVLIHMTYKVGEPGLRKYHSFFHDFAIYLDNQTNENREKVANDFIYHYTSGKKVLLDTRVMKIHHDMFLAKPVYAHNHQDAPVNKEKPLTEQEKYLKASKEISEQWTLHSIWQNIVQNYAKAQMNRRNEMNNDNDQNQSVSDDGQQMNSDNNETSVQDNEDNQQVSYQVTRLIEMSKNGQQITTIRIQTNGNSVVNGDDEDDSDNDDE